MSIRSTGGTACLYLVAITARATTIDVPGDHSTIQAAIDATAIGDTVLVSPGTYFESELRYAGKAIVVRSLDPSDPLIVAATVIDADSSGPVFVFDGSEDRNSVLTGLTITGGSAQEGAGIVCAAASPLISDCRLVDNVAMSQGGGIHCDAASPTIRACEIEGNGAAHAGGGVSCVLGAYPHIVDCTLLDNGAFRGGGVYCFASSPTIERSLVRGNTAPME